MSLKTKREDKVEPNKLAFIVDNSDDEEYNSFKELHYPDPTLYKHTKRAPNYKIQENDIYVTRKSVQKAQIKRARELLEEKRLSNVIIYGLGSQITRAVDLAMKLKEFYGDLVVIRPQTDTVELIDDFEPLRDDLEPFSQIRKNSAMKLTLSLK
jgi:DNA-binding protein